MDLFVEFKEFNDVLINPGYKQLQVIFYYYYLVCWPPVASTETSLCGCGKSCFGKVEEYRYDIIAGFLLLVLQPQS
jgi:hypothetical protein